MHLYINKRGVSIKRPPLGQVAGVVSVGRDEARHVVEDRFGGFGVCIRDAFTAPRDRVHRHRAHSGCSSSIEASNAFAPAADRATGVVVGHVDSEEVPIEVDRRCLAQRNRAVPCESADGSSVTYEQLSIHGLQEATERARAHRSSITARPETSRRLPPCTSNSSLSPMVAPINVPLSSKVSFISPTIRRSGLAYLRSRLISNRE